MTNKELKDILKTMPDDYEVVVDIPKNDGTTESYTIENVVYESFTIPIKPGKNSIEKIVNIIVLKL